MNRFWTLLLCALVFLAAFPIDAASVPAIDIDPRTDVADPPGPGQYRGYDFGHIDWVIGWSFAVEEPVTLTHLAWYDEDGDGLSHEHRIGLWTSTDFAIFELLAEATVPSGTGGSVFGPWRSMPVGPIDLLPGWYILGGLDNGESTDGVKFVIGTPPPPLLVDPRIKSDSPVAAFRSDTVFGPPTDTLLVPSLYVGPMAFIEPVPEPSTLALFVIGALLVGARAARRRSASQT